MDQYPTNKQDTTEHPIFNKPLTELNYTEARNKFYAHPDASGHIIRIEDFGAKHDALFSGYYAKKVTQDLESRYDIPHVNFNQVIGENVEEHDVNLYSMVEKIEDAVPMKALYDMGHVGPDVRNEIDHVACGLAKYVRDLIQEGGVLCRDYTRLDQFVISPSREEGKRFVLVDIEAFDPIAISRPDAEHPDPERLLNPIRSLLSLSRDIINFKKLAKSDLFAMQDLREAVSVIPDDQVEEINRAKADLLRAIDTEDVSIIQDLIEQGDDEEHEDPYWSEFETRHYGTPSVVSFASHEAIDHYIQTGER
jgi:hypothetical protein